MRRALLKNQSGTTHAERAVVVLFKAAQRDLDAVRPLGCSAPFL